MEIFKPKEINFLNISDRIVESTFTEEEFTLTFTVSNKIFKQKRVVYDFLMMFGDVGGLSDFNVIIFGTILGFFANRFMHKELMTGLFHVSEKVNFQ